MLKSRIAPAPRPTAAYSADHKVTLAPLACPYCAHKIRAADAEMHDNVVRLVFGGSEERFDEFVRVVREDIPEGTRVVLRGSAITGHRWKDGLPFDAEGPGTSDLDLTLVGDEVIGLFTVTGFFVPGLHSRPLSDDDPGIAPPLVALRETLMALTGRPVNIQASRDVVIQFRGDLLGQPYLLLIDRAEKPAA